MRLKIVTTACLISTVVLMLALPWFLQMRPAAAAPLKERRDYALKFLIYQGVVVATVTAAGVGSLLILRDVRREFREESRRNMEALLEGARRDALKTAERPTEDDA